MTTKTEMIERLGETAVLLPSLIGDALTANDRIKLRLSLLQEAAAQTQAPSREPRSFRAECDDARLDARPPTCWWPAPGRRSDAALHTGRRRIARRHDDRSLGDARPAAPCR